jgi:hypothetical protein
LICCHTNFGFVARVQIRPNDWRELLGRNFIECITLFLVGV